MPNNRQMAAQRLQSLKRKMKRDEQYKEEYFAFLHNIFESYAEEVPQDEVTEPTRKIWCVPHNGVCHHKKKKTTTTLIGF